MANFTSALSRAREHLTAGLEGQDENKNKEMPDLFTRDIGGEFRKNQPFFTGYHQVLFYLPEKVFSGTDEISQKWLSSTCENFTAHTVTPNFVDVMGVGQTGASFMTGKTIGREFTLAFREFQNLPIMSIIDLWHNVFDSHLGVSSLSGSDFIPSSYKGSCIVFQLKPTGGNGQELTAADVEEVYSYHGVFPKTNPRDTVGASDQTANDTVQLSVTFSFDGAPLTAKDGILNVALDKLNSLGNYKDTHNLFRDAFNKSESNEAS